MRILIKLYNLILNINRGYAVSNLNSSFWDNNRKIAFEQMALGLLMWGYYKRIKLYQTSQTEKERNKLKFIWTLCIFDMMCIPVNSVLGVWRGYEFLYIARIVMGCTILYLFERGLSVHWRLFTNLIVLVILVAWLVFRFWSIWEDALLMPYVFEPFIKAQ